MRNGKQEMIHGVRASATLTSGWWRRIGLLCLVLALAVALPAQNQHAVTFKTLVSFEGTNGAGPFSALVQDTDGNLYGTTGSGGTYGGGTVFEVTPSGSLTVLYNFCAQPNCTDGLIPDYLVAGSDASLFGATGLGGATGNGTVFKVTPGATPTTLYNFCALTNCADGSIPIGFVLGTDGNFYGTTAFGGNGSGSGTVFKLTPGGALTTLYNFCSQPNCVDGSLPDATVIQGADGNFYGTTEGGGANCAPYGCGTVFKITPSGTLTTLYSFCAKANCVDGSTPAASPLVQAADGNLYGTTAGGGTFDGTFFRITPGGALTTLYSFCSQPHCVDGFAPQSPLVQAADGNFYGETPEGGAYNGGTVFKITPSGKLTTLYSFCAQPNCTDGGGPNGLVLGTDRNFYGTTSGGGASDSCGGGCGTVFGLSVGHKPFAEAQPSSGKGAAHLR